MADKETKTVDFEKLQNTVAVGVRMQDNVINATPYFLEENKIKLLESDVLDLVSWVLHDILIYCETEYGSEKGNKLVDQVFETIATTAYQNICRISQRKRKFPIPNW